MAFPAASYLSNAARNEGEMKAALEAWLAATKMLPGGGLSLNVEIVSGSVTPAAPVLRVKPEGAASSDELTNLAPTNFGDGSFLFLGIQDAAKPITVKHMAGGVGQISLSCSNADFVMTSLFDFLVLVQYSNVWYEWRRWKAKAVAGSELFTSSGTFTVPALCTEVEVWLCGGGGGGGGGAGSGSGGGAGGTGGDADSTEIVGAFGTIAAEIGLGGGGGSQTIPGAASATSGIKGQNGGHDPSLPGNGGSHGIALAIGGVSTSTRGRGGAGGAGATVGSPNGYPGAGGGGGGLAIRRITGLVPGASITVTVGAGGTAGAAGSAGAAGAAGSAGAAGTNGFVAFFWGPQIETGA